MTILLATYVLLLLLLTVFNLIGSTFLFLLLVIGAPLIAVVEISTNPVLALLAMANRLYLFVAIMYAVAYALLTSTITLVVVHTLELTLPPLKVVMTILTFILVHIVVTRIFRI